MIRKTLRSTISATFSLDLPSSDIRSVPTPTGTGFFISPDGYFLTAAHVVCKDGKPRNDIQNGRLSKESRIGIPPHACQFIEPVFVDQRTDIAVLKVDFEQNRPKDWLKDRDDFPYVSVSSRVLELGEPVYSFGYPLSSSEVKRNDGVMTVVVNQLGPRVTSAIVSSDIDKTAHIMRSSDPQNYVLDKALNYGNSGGPIISSDTGNVHAICSRFQPVYVPQAHLRGSGQSDTPSVMIPSLYGVVSSLRNSTFVDMCAELGIAVRDN